jgi:hypothetical protein
MRGLGTSSSSDPSASLCQRLVRRPVLSAPPAIVVEKAWYICGRVYLLAMEMDAGGDICSRYGKMEVQRLRLSTLSPIHYVGRCEKSEVQVTILDTYRRQRRSKDVCARPRSGQGRMEIYGDDSVRGIAHFVRRDLPFRR